MSHHLDSPRARQDVRLDITDLYVFQGETGTAFVIDVCHSIAGNIPVPYTIRKVRMSSRSILTATRRRTLRIASPSESRDSAGMQAVELRRLTGPAAADPHAKGSLIAQGGTGQTITGPDGVRTPQTGD